jgi:hypothetical protein
MNLLLRVELAGQGEPTLFYVSRSIGSVAVSVSCASISGAAVESTTA